MSFEKPEVRNKVMGNPVTNCSTLVEEVWAETQLCFEQKPGMKLYCIGLDQSSGNERRKFRIVHHWRQMMTKLPTARDLRGFASRCGLDQWVVSCRGSTKCWLIKTLLHRVGNCGHDFIIVIIIITIIHESIKRERHCLRGRLIASSGRYIFFSIRNWRGFPAGVYPGLQIIKGQLVSI